jgi:DNA polymerase-1
LQNPPGTEFRRVFTAGDGKLLIVADYSQLELRILAHVSKCESMIANLCSGADYHSATALDMFPRIKIPVDQVKLNHPTERAQAKVLNFSIVYGKSVRSLAQDLHLTEKAASDLLEAWFDSKPEVRRWKSEIVTQVHNSGCSYSLIGRPRYFPHIQHPRLRSRSERAAVNHCIQGSAADLAVSAMLRVRNSEILEQLGFHMVLQVHDEFILEGPQEHATQALAVVKDLMENPFADISPLFKFRVPMLVDAGIGKTWAQAKP